jgi:hypothetical protein
MRRALSITCCSPVKHREMKKPFGLTKEKHTMKSEYTANHALQAQAEERTRWAAVLARPVNRTMRSATVRRSLFARLLGL